MGALNSPVLNHYIIKLACIQLNMDVQLPPDDAFASCCISLRVGDPPKILTDFFSRKNLNRNPLSALNKCRKVSVYNKIIPYMIQVTVLEQGRPPHYFSPVPPKMQLQFPSIGEFVQWPPQSLPGKAVVWIAPVGAILLEDFDWWYSLKYNVVHPTGDTGESGDL